MQKHCFYLTLKQEQKKKLTFCRNIKGEKKKVSAESAILRREIVHHSEEVYLEL